MLYVESCLPLWQQKIISLFYDFLFVALKYLARVPASRYGDRRQKLSGIRQMVKSQHRVAALIYDDLCTFEFGIVAELFGLPRPEFDFPWYDFMVVPGEHGALRDRARRLRPGCADRLDLRRRVRPRRGGDP